MSNQTVDQKNNLIVVIDKPVDGYQEGRVVIADHQGSRCVDVLNLDMSEVGDLKEIGDWVIEAVRNPRHFEDYVLQQIIKSPTGSVTPDRLYQSMIDIFKTPGQARHQAQLYHDRLEEPVEDDDVLKGGIDRAVAWWYMTGYVIHPAKGLDLIHQTKVGRVLRAVALGSDPIAEIA